jgi:hypothetical protein
MLTVARPTIKAKFVHLYDADAIIAKVNNGLYVFHPDGRVEDFTIEMAPFVAILGDVGLAEVQAMWDRVAGGPAKVACSREQGVS